MASRELGWAFWGRVQETVWGSHEYLVLVEWGRGRDHFLGSHSPQRAAIPWCTFGGDFRPCWDPAKDGVALHSIWGPGLGLSSEGKAGAQCQGTLQMFHTCFAGPGDWSTHEYWGLGVLTPAKCPQCYQVHIFQWRGLFWMSAGSNSKRLSKLWPDLQEQLHWKLWLVGTFQANGPSVGPLSAVSCVAKDGCKWFMFPIFEKGMPLCTFMFQRKVQVNIKRHNFQFLRLLGQKEHSRVSGPNAFFYRGRGRP